MKVCKNSKNTPLWNTIKFAMGNHQSELYLVLMLCTSELDLNNSLFLTTNNNKEIYTGTGEVRLPNF